MQSVTIQPDFQSWREAARKLLVRETPPEQVVFCAGDDSPLLPLFVESGPSAVLSGRALPRVPGGFLSAARSAAMHRDADRWSLLYRILWRLTHGEPHLMHITTDDDVALLMSMDKQVHRDIHKMHAFVRFRKVVDDDGDHFIAWHRPDHLIVHEAGPWFAKRFAAMRWTILTPDESVAWDLHALHYGPGVPRSAAPSKDDLEELWKTYYVSIFNPARLKIKAMKKELPVRHWATLPEAELIDQLIHDASPRVENFMPAAESKKAAPATAAEFVPASRELPVLRLAIQNCKGCDLYCHATQAVFGEGPATASIMFVGEQPGDQEDLAGKPFVGPAGQLLDRAMRDADIDRGRIYVTNAVKHFKFEERGKRRIHAKPSAREMNACRPWLEAEIESVRPKLLVCLGATAAQTLMGPQFRITRDRGQIFSDTRWAPAVVATIHPSAILRAPDDAARQQMHEAFVADLKIVRNQIDHIAREEADAHQKPA
jgi:DNA polymerase